MLKNDMIVSEHIQMLWTSPNTVTLLKKTFPKENRDFLEYLEMEKDCFFYRVSLSDQVEGKVKITGHL